MGTNPVSAFLARKYHWKRKALAVDSLYAAAPRHSTLPKTFWGQEDLPSAKTLAPLWGVFWPGLRAELVWRITQAVLELSNNMSTEASAQVWSQVQVCQPELNEDQLDDEPMFFLEPEETRRLSLLGCLLKPSLVIPRRFQRTMGARGTKWQQGSASSGFA